MRRGDEDDDGEAFVCRSNGGWWGLEVGSRLPLFQKTFLWLVDGYQKEFYPPDFTGARRRREPPLI